MKIASFCFAGFPGSNASLHSLSRAVGLSRHFVLSGSGANSPELDFFAGYLQEQQPKLVIFGAWTPAYQVLLDALPPETEAAVLWNSSGGQVDISGEASLFATIMEHPRIRYRFFARSALARAFSSRADHYELPAAIPVPPHARPRLPNKTPIVSLFCSLNEYRRKNIVNSLLAVAQQTQPYLLYLNGLSENPEYRRLLAQFRVRYRDWGWMPRKQYERVLRRVDIGLQVSFAESFNFVAAEHFLLGIPVLGSRMVPALDPLPARVKQRCIVNNPDDPSELANKLDYLLSHPAARQSLGQIGRLQLLKTNEKNIVRAKTLLLKIIAE